MHYVNIMLCLHTSKPQVCFPQVGSGFRDQGLGLGSSVGAESFLCLMCVSALYVSLPCNCLCLICGSERHSSDAFLCLICVPLYHTCSSANCDPVSDKLPSATHVSVGAACVPL